MGQAGSRSVCDVNQTTEKRLTAIQCNNLSDKVAPQLDASEIGAESESPTPRSLLIGDAKAMSSGRYGTLNRATNPSNSKEELQQQQKIASGSEDTTSKRPQPLRRLVRVRRRACPCCAPVECLHCRHEAPSGQVNLQQGSEELQCCSACCATPSLCHPLEREASQMAPSSRAGHWQAPKCGGASPDEVTGAAYKATARRHHRATKCNEPPGDSRRARKVHRLAYRFDNQLVRDGHKREHRLMDLTSSRSGGGADLLSNELSLTTPASCVSSASTASTLSLVSSASASSNSTARLALVTPHDAISAAHSNTTATTLATAAAITTQTVTTNSATQTAQPDQLICGGAAANNNDDTNNLVCGPLNGGLSKLVEPGESPNVVVDEHKNQPPDSKITAATHCHCNQSEIEIQGASSLGADAGQPIEKERDRQCASEELSATATSKDYLVWNDLALRYGSRMSRRTSRQATTTGEMAGELATPPTWTSCANSPPRRHPNGRWSGGGGNDHSNTSCLYHILCALLQTLFPIISSLKNYSLPSDLATDLAAGFTVAVLHIPQGMAYGLLSGVEPIYGLYVSFIPVLVMALMSKSRHVSYGTFAVISMLLVSTIENVRASINKDFMVVSNVASEGSQPRSLPLVITDNHQPADSDQQRQFLLKNLIKQSGNELDPVRPLPSGVSASLLVDSAGLLGNSLGDTNSDSSFIVNPPTNIEILACACLVCGIIHITMSLMRLGVLSLMFSDQLVSSFTTASAIHVLTSQLAGLFDLNLAPIHEELFKIVRIWWQFGHALLFEHFNQTTALLSLASIAFLLLVKQIVEPALRKRYEKLTCLPSELALMAVVILCSWYFKFESNYNVKIIGYVPTGLPEARTPRLELVPYVLKDSVTIALISFAMNLSIAQVYAKRFRYELDANQELFAVGTANIVSSFFSCFPCASSLSRSSVQSSLNVRSQLCALFSCAIVVLIICFFAHILHDLPRSTLSCIIVVALKGILMQLRDFYDNWRLSKLDALVWMVTFVAVIVFGVTYGLIIGIVASLFMIFLRLLTPNHSILGRLPETEIYVDVDAFAECEEIQRVKIFRFNSALCYLNRTQLKAKIEQLLPSIYKPQGFGAICAHLHRRNSPHNQASINVHFLIIDCSALSYCDYSGAATLVELIEDLEREKVTVYLAACPLKLIDMLEKMKSTGKILSENVFPTISVAVGHAMYLLSSEKDIDPLKMSMKPSQTKAQQATSGTTATVKPTESSILDLS